MARTRDERIPREDFPIIINRNKMKQPRIGRTVKLRKDEPIDSALKRLKDRMESEGIVDDMKQHRYFENEKKRAERKRRSQKQRWNREWHYTSKEEVYI